ncbi:MAG: hypothetical protein AAGE18_03995 [Pseudomonadota bacterium]
MIRCLTAALLTLSLATVAAQAQDRQEGYYYPEITSVEEYTRNLPAPEATREDRLSFIASLMRAQGQLPYPNRMAIFAKGAAAEKLIIVALDDGIFRTLHRARGQMAIMTTVIRQLPFFAERGLQFNVTFYDMIQMLDFDHLTLSDGITWAHRVDFPD